MIDGWETLIPKRLPRTVATAMEAVPAVVANIVKIDGVSAMRAQDCLGVLHGASAIADADFAATTIPANGVGEDSGFAVRTQPFGVLLQTGTARTATTTRETVIGFERLDSALFASTIFQMICPEIDFSRVSIQILVFHDSPPCLTLLNLADSAFGTSFTARAKLGLRDEFQADPALDQ